MTRTTLRTTTALLAAGLAASLVAGFPVADASEPVAERQPLIAPLKNTTYSGTTTSSDGISVRATVKIGNDKNRVKKAVVRLSCAAGAQKFTRKNVKMYDIGRFYADEPTTGISGLWTGKHKVEVSVQTANELPCSNRAFILTLRD